MEGIVYLILKRAKWYSGNSSEFYSRRAQFESWQDTYLSYPSAPFIPVHLT